ncbi:TonB-dependent receptor [Massilibacteroides vaginae]|uniref:TonB-dependent receptor n=1 Tax=Massilibacteroides vaginae TaxID=1673718 RepID=UPI000A1C8AF4|nr:TonB-dependent receptor [Massilibacteroides vaginae]
MLMIKIRTFLLLFSLACAYPIAAQVTTASMSGIVTDTEGAVIGATIVVTHEPSGTTYGTITNENGRYTLSGMRTGGPYKAEVSYIGYQPAVYTEIQLQLGDNYLLNASLKESSEELSEVVVTASKNSNMKSDRAGAITNINSERMALLPTVSRSMNDVMRLTPQGGNTGNGFAVGGGNFRQSFVTVDGAAFNNAFGIGSNLPAGGSPISLDALEQISVSVTPYDVRQSGFTGGAINAVTKSGTNQIKGTAYTYISNQDWKGNHVADVDLTREESKYHTYGGSLGGAIIKNKLFFFINGEYEDNVTAGPSAKARSSESADWGSNTANIHRPTVSDMDMMSNFLQTKYGYNPGRYQNYSIETPAYRLLGRLDWNINNDHKVNVRFSRTHMKDSNSPSSSTSPLTTNTIYPGGDGISAGSGRTSYPGLYFESSRYYQEQNFTSYAAEWNSKWLNGKLNNTLRATYSYQEEPRTYVGGAFPTVDILKAGSVYASFGPDPFTPGNLREVKTLSFTDEVSMSIGMHNLFAGIQFESNDAVNGFMQGGNGYYIFSSWEDFANGNKPSAFGVTHSNSEDLSQFEAKMKTQQYAFYVQDQINFNDNFKLTAGLRFELPVYPNLKNNYNEAYYNLNFAKEGQPERHFSTDQLPSAKISVSPRVGFNWDLTGERKYVLRGGTGIFVGRLPFVWLVSAVGNSNVGQTQYYYNTAAQASGVQPGFHANVQDILKELYGGNFKPAEITAPSSPTIIDKDLKMPSTWKTSLAFDAKLPGDVDFTVEGIFNKDINPSVITNENLYADGSTIQLSPNDVRNKYARYTRNNAFLITNAGGKAHYYSITTQLAKNFNFGLDLSFAYTYSNSKAYNDGLGSQVTSAYRTNTNSINGVNDNEIGYGSYVSPHRIVASLGYRIGNDKTSSAFSLIYEGMNMAYNGGYAATRYSYTLAGNVVGDGGANNLLYIPSSREELNNWVFAEETRPGTPYMITDDNGEKIVYTANQQRDDFWAYINQDSYLKNHKGEYADRNGAVMPWHHQLDFKFVQDYNFLVGGKKNTLQFGIDVKNFLNLLNRDWGLYKSVNNNSLLSYNTAEGTANGYTFQQNNGKRLTESYTKYNSFASTYSIQFSLRYIFN